MSQPTPREIMDGFEAARAKTFYYMAKAMIDELGEERGKQIIRETVYKMSKASGETTKKRYTEEGKENTWENHRAENGPIYSVAWIGETTQNEPDLKIIEYTYCPLGAAFTRRGKEAEEIGDIYCSVTDDAFWSGFNPEWRVTREKTFSKNGVCRLVWRRD
ncbi:MAG: L-2-amino-thiazoline-4-carboxylic acid hydrolase [Candidatus Bathyarchaeota archaeon]|nr:L-2-amino-thiazoline-4-carboxylic acid hydrolase [Candidatus Bathyarchaeota archaeon]